MKLLIYIPDYKLTTPSTGGVLKNHCSMKNVLNMKYTFTGYEDNNRFIALETVTFFPDLNNALAFLCGFFFGKHFKTIIRISPGHQ